MSKTQKSVLLVSTALSLSLTAPVVVRAADSVVAAGQAQIEEVVVTARRREERLQDVPISITVYNQQQLQNHNVMNAEDLATYTPSLQVDNQFGPVNTTFALRGFTQDLGTAPSVGVFFDDVVAPRGLTQGTTAGDGAGPGDFFDLQNVQVLNGPQGTLFGRNTTGGDILLVPNKPTDEFGGYVQGSFGNYDMRGGQGVINIPVNDDFRLRFGIDHESRDGYLNNTSGIGPSDFDDLDYTALRASADIDVTPDLEEYLVASFAHSDTNGDFMKLVACNPRLLSATGTSPFLYAACEQLGMSASEIAAQSSQAAKLAGTSPVTDTGTAPPQGSGFYDGAENNPSPYTKYQLWRVISTTTWHESDELTVKNIASFAQLSEYINNPLFGTNFSTLSTNPNVNSFPFQFASVTNIPGLPFADQGTYTEELQTQGDYLDNRLTYQFGAYLEGSIPMSLGGPQSPTAAYCNPPGSLNCFDVVTGDLDSVFGIKGKNGLPATSGQALGVYIGSVGFSEGATTTNDYALYTQDTYKLTDQLSLTGGFRYTWDRMSNTSQRIGYDFGYPQDPTAPYALLPSTIVNANCANPTAPGFKTAGGALAGYPSGKVPPGDCYEAATVDSSAPTWLIESDYKPTDDIMGYIKWARGYRQGVVSPNVPPPFNVTKPETLDDYEAGVKTAFDMYGISGIFDIDGFYDKLRDQQVLQGFGDANPDCGADIPVGYANPTAACPTPTEAVLNLGKSHIHGAEVNATVVPYEGVSLQLGYTHLYTDITQANLAYNYNKPAPANLASLPTQDLYIIQPTAKAGDPLLLSPRNKLTLTLAYTLPLDDSIGKVTLSSTYTYTDPMVLNYIDAAVPGFGYLGSRAATNILDFNLNWEQIMGKPLDLAVFATNVTDDQYYTWVGGLLNTTGFETANVGEPTFYGFRVTYHFGEE
jgi:iron complex outermembrane recepter protein